MRTSGSGRRAMRPITGMTALAALVAGCDGTGAGAGGSLADAGDPAPQAHFWSRLAARCGQAFGGAITSNDAADADLMGRPLVIHFAACRPDEIRIAMHVWPGGPGRTRAVTDGADGWDRSRIWVLRRQGKVIALSHHHRHRDGSPDAVTGYGGTSDGQGSPERQRFPVDDASKALFRRIGRPDAMTNVWTIDVAAPGQVGARLGYALTRPSPAVRQFRALFDLDRPVPAPPPAWGQASPAPAGG